MDPMSTVTIAGQQFEIVDAEAREQIEEMGALKPRNLYGMQDGRATTANIAPTGSNSLQYLLATSTMTEGKPPIGDSKILHMEWDNTGGWTTQAAFGHAASLNAATAMAMRRMSSGTWGDWKTLLDLLYPVGSVYINNTNTNPSGTLGGTWSLIHKGFEYQIVNDPITFNTTNTQSGASVAILNGNQIELRMTFAPKVELNDSTVTIGQLNLADIGLTGKYGEYIVYMNDAAGGFAMLQISNTGAITSVETVTKVNAMTIQDGASIDTGKAISPTTSTGQARASLMFAQTSMVDSFCDEFHWKRTA